MVSTVKPPGVSPRPDPASSPSLSLSGDAAGSPGVADCGAKAGTGPRSRVDLIRWMSVMDRLAALSRFSMESLSRRESVLEHTGQVALTALMLASELQSMTQVDVGTVLTRALVHDLEEVITGDVARPTKHASKEAEKLFADLSAQSVQALARRLDPSVPFFSRRMVMSHGAAKSKGLEGLIVALSDILAVVTKVWEEVILRGSGAMLRQAHTARRQLAGFQARLDKELEKTSPAHEFLSCVVLDALGVCDEAVVRDSRWLGTEVENY